MTVVTVFDGHESALDASTDGTGPAARRAEDEAALAELSARLVSFGLPEARLRLDAGVPRYRSTLAVRRLPHQRDHRIPDEVASLLRPYAEAADEVLAPLGVATHVDHALTRLAVDLMAMPDRIRYYPEFPYPPVEPAGLTRTWLTVRFSPWLRAALRYRSQVDAMFGGPLSFARALSRRAQLTTSGTARWAQWEVAS